MSLQLLATPAAPFAAMIAPRNEQSSAASVQAIAVAGSGSSFLSTVNVAAACAGTAVASGKVVVAPRPSSKPA